MTDRDTAVFPLAQMRQEIRDGDDRVRSYVDDVATRVKDHMARNTAQSLGPVAALAEKHEQQLNNTRDSELGLVRKVDSHSFRIQAMENAAKTNGEMLSDLHRHFVLETTVNERTPKRGTPTVEIADSERPAKRSPLIDKDTLRLLLIVLAALAGTGGGTAAFQAMSAPPQQAVQVQAEAVAEKREDLERRERELARREAWVARQVATRRSTEPTMPEPVPATPVATGE